MANTKEFKDLKEMLNNTEKEFSDEIAFKVKYRDENCRNKIFKIN